MAIAVTTNGSDFRARMESRIANLKIGVQRRIVLFATECVQHLILETPILTGAARANWQVGINTPPTVENVGRTRPPTEIGYDSYEASALAELDSYTTGDTIYIVNNSPYIAALNAGSSTQAPAGFIESAVSNATATLKAQTGGLLDG